MINKILIALVLAVVVSGNVYANDKEVLPQNNWSYLVESDPINGRVEGVVYENKKNQRMIFWKESLSIRNGDGYICRCTNCYEVQQGFIYGIFKIDNNASFGLDIHPYKGDHLNLLNGYMSKYQSLGIRYNREAIKDISDGKLLGGRKLNLKKFANKLKNSKKLLIRTIDGCKTQTDVNIDLNGFSEAIDKLFPYLDDDLKNR